MASMAGRSSTSVIPAPDGAPNSWGLGDGQAIPWEYAPAPEARDIVTLKERYGLFIDGRVRARHRTATRSSSIDPATEQPLAKVAQATPADVDKAVRCRATRPAPVVGPAAGPGAGEVPVPDRADPPGALARVRGPRIDGLGQADQGDRATSTCRSPRRTSGTTRAGRTSSSTRSPGGSPGRWASPPRSSPGTSRC